jgi:hypothetical protein
MKVCRRLNQISRCILQLERTSDNFCKAIQQIRVVLVVLCGEVIVRMKRNDFDAAEKLRDVCICLYLSRDIVSASGNDIASSQHLC